MVDAAAVAARETVNGLAASLSAPSVEQGGDFAGANRVCYSSKGQSRDGWFRLLHAGGRVPKLPGQRLLLETTPKVFVRFRSVPLFNTSLSILQLSRA